MAPKKDDTSAVKNGGESEKKGKDEPATLSDAPPRSLLPASPAKFLGLVYIPTWLIFLVSLAGFLWVLWGQIKIAYNIRMYAIRDFGYVIHEFDPWFNFRATIYLSKNGWHKFFHWYDYMSWYPLGRPVGTTIYPGLQLTGVAIHRALRYLGKPYSMTLNNVCCLIPAWFGSVATVFTSLLAYECSGSLTAGAVTSAVMAIVPAHLMRSVGGGFDNESIAMSAMVITFYFWVRSLRTSGSWWWGVLTGLAYGNMVAAWGGFIFVLNMIVLHAAVLAVVDMLRGTYSKRLFYAYSLFYIIGTFIATFVPPVGMMPFKSLEQLSATLVFVVLAALHLSERERTRGNHPVLSVAAVTIRAEYVGAAVGIVGVVAAFIIPEGFFGPLSSRVRALFVKHMKTGNPLVDSVAEHRPASADAYWQYLHHGYIFWQVGLVAAWLLNRQRMRGALFLFCYGIAAYYFSVKMARLILLAAPVSACLTGIVIGGAFDWACSTLLFPPNENEESPPAETGIEVIESVFKTVSASMSLARNSDKDKEKTVRDEIARQASSLAVKRAIAVALVAGGAFMLPGMWAQFQKHSEDMAQGFSNPRVMLRHWVRGQPVIIDDYRQAYFWLRDNTPEDSRVLSWWDYGYQITGIGNRTTLADGNTWNHEHIATIGVMLSSPVARAHKLIRHVADYVLVWGGNGNDDLGKSPHMARIGNSVYRGHCPHDPLCQQFGFQEQNYGSPTKMMRESLLYNAVKHNMEPGVRMDPKYFTEAYTSKHGLVRIFKVTNISESSKQWLADPANRICDAPGSWHCGGQYPNVPVWKKLLARRKNFGQLEDFNKRRNTADDKYYEEYMKKIQGH